MTRLSPHAKQALEILEDKHLAYSLAKTTIEAELKREFHERISSFRLERDTALRLAEEAGVPRTQLGKAIGTTNYRTVQDILQETGKITQTDSDGNKWSLTALPNGNYSLSVNDIGNGHFTGTAEVNIKDGDIRFISGDLAVIPSIYRFGYSEAICASI